MDELDKIPEVQERRKFARELLSVLCEAGFDANLSGTRVDVIVHLINENGGGLHVVLGTSYTDSMQDLRRLLVLGKARDFVRVLSKKTDTSDEKAQIIANNDYAVSELERVRQVLRCNADRLK